VSEAAAAVRWLLEQSEPEARRVAVQQIAKVRGQDVSDLLLRALADDDWRVRKEATLVAGVLDHRDEVVASLIAALEETVNIGLRNAAVEALIRIGSDAVGATIDALGRLDAEARKLCVEVLGGVADPRAVAALSRALADDDANVRVAAAEALGNAALAGDDARDDSTRALVVALATSDTFLKIAALESLARLEAQLPWAVFQPCASDPLLRRYAIVAAAGSSEPDAIRALAQATGDPSPTIVREAVVALGERIGVSLSDDGLLQCARAAMADNVAGRDNARRAARDAEDSRARGGALLVLGLLRDPQDVATLVEALSDDDVAERADHALRLFGPRVVKGLLSVARHAKPRVRAAALALAASLEGANVDDLRSALREALKGPGAEVMACAVGALGSLGDAGDLRRVSKLVGHADERIAATATKSAAELATRFADAARDLLRDAKPGKDPVAFACVLLGAIASKHPLNDDDVARLERALAHDDPKVRRAAVDALARADSQAAADAVVFALADEEQEVKLSAVRALGRLRRPEPLLAIVSDTRDPALAATALRALGEADRERALFAARPMIGHPDAAIACAAVEVIGFIDSSGTLGQARGSAAALEDALFVALDHAEGEVVKLALSMLGAHPGARALARLGLCLDHSSWEVRRLAAELLGQAKSPSAEALLRARYELESDPMVREAIALAVSLRPAPANLSEDFKAGE
jgi:HEAT repeat protein